MNTAVTAAQVAEEMSNVKVDTIDIFGKPTTVVSVRMSNGYVLTETSTCVDPLNYDETIGLQVCQKKIEDRVWALLGYKLHDTMAEGVKTSIDRLQIERKELSDKLVKLDAFIDSDRFATVVYDSSQRMLLFEQSDIMAEYLKILDKRIEYLASKEVSSK